MKFKTGDKVKFLNETGGGYVTKIISSALVEVGTDDGFNIPFAAKDLILVDDQGVASQFFDEDFGGQPKESTEDYSNMTHEVSTELFKRQSLDLKKGLFLAFVPQDQKWLMTGLIDVYLVNYSEYDVLFSFYLQGDGQFESKDYDVIGPQNKFLIETIDRDDINDWQKSHIQALFILKEQEKIIAPLNKKIQIKGSKFYQESNYKHIDLLEANALTVEIVGMDYQEMISKSDPISEKDVPIEQEKKVVIKKKKSLIEGHKTGLLEAEVDLHISALSDDFDHLKPQEILDEQLNYFNKTLEDAMIHQYKKVIYIHGIGNGTLKKKLKDELRSYEEIEVRDASFQHYGYGAVEVKILYK